MLSAIAKNGTAYDLHGNLDGHVLVLIHGLGLTRHTWDAFVPVLSEQFGVVTYDLFGHGESISAPQKPSLSVYAEQLCQLLDEIHVAKAVLVGFSLGGMINRRFAMDYPDRTQALAIFNSPHERGEAAQKLVEERAAAADAGGPAATLDAAIERWFTPEFRASQPSVIAMVKEWILANEPEDYAQARQVLANGVVELIRPQPPIKLPSLVITAEHDVGSNPAMSKAIASENDNAHCEIISGLRHLGLMEQPALFIKPLLSFLKRAELH